MLTSSGPLSPIHANTFITCSPTLLELDSAMPVLCPGWTDQFTCTSSPLEEIRLCKISIHPSSSSQPMIMSHSLMVASDLTCKVYVYDREVISKNTQRSPPSSVTNQLNSNSLGTLLQLLDTAKVCPGNRDPKFQQMVKYKKQVFSSADGNTVAYAHSGFCFTLNGEIFNCTVRTTGCDILVHEGKCLTCRDYRPTLRAMYSRWLNKPSSVKTPKILIYQPSFHEQSTQKF